jgi:hypothetical protein
MIKNSEEFETEAVCIALIRRTQRFWGLGSQRSVIGRHRIGQPIWYQHLKQIWRVRMNGCTQRTLTPGRRGASRKGRAVLRQLTPVRFALAEMLCRIMRVSSRGYRSWRARPVCVRERTHMAELTPFG